MAEIEKRARAAANKAAVNREQAAGQMQEALLTKLIKLQIQEQM